MRWRPVLLAALLVAVAGACSSSKDGTVETSIAEGPDTLYDVTTTLGEPSAIAGGVADDVARGLGVTFTAAQRGCIVDALGTTSRADVLDAYAADPVVLTQPSGVQDVIFATVDDCVTPDGYAAIAAPGLVAAGAKETSAECYFRTIREELGSEGLYTYFIAIDGETPDTTTPGSAPTGTDVETTDPGVTDAAGDTSGATTGETTGETATSVSQREAERVITRTYRTCGIDRTQLTTTTTEAPTTTTPDDPTASSG
jgi:hypothetical protein